MPRIRRSQLLLPIALVAVGILYYAAEPSQQSWWLRCPFHTLTGYSCPGCGAQRALHALLHGHLATAAAHNYFLALALPLWAAYHLSARCPRLAPLRRRFSSTPMLIAYLLLTLAWGIVRNLWGL